MAQFDFGDLESPVTGTDLINNNLEPWRDALNSGHSGTTRPSYAVPGLRWIDTTSTTWILNMFDGTNDIKMGSIDTVNHVYIPITSTTWTGTAGGTANALTIAPSPAPTAYVAGDLYTFLIGTTNTADNPTLKVGALAVKNIKTNLGVGKIGAPKGSLVAGTVIIVVYDGTDFVQLNPRANNIASSIATASSVNLNNANGDYVELTGTTTITSFVLDEGQQRVVRAGDDFTLSNNANIINPGGADINAVDGDIFVLRGEASSVVRVIAYTKANGESIVSSSAGFTTATAIASTSGGAIDFTSIPAGTKMIVIGFMGVSSNSSNAMKVQLGDSGGVETTGYKGTGHFMDGGFAGATYTDGFGLNILGASYVWSGGIILSLQDESTNTWVCNGNVSASNSAASLITSGDKSLSAELDRVRVSAGGASFDAGKLSVSYI